MRANSWQNKNNLISRNIFRLCATQMWKIKHHPIKRSNVGFYIVFGRMKMFSQIGGVNCMKYRRLTEFRKIR
jgi:hypothetical protein